MLEQYAVKRTSKSSRRLRSWAASLTRTRQKAHNMHNMVDREYFAASAMISPAKVSDVQGIMRLCNEFEVPV
jgi:hypothetical protein